jgi:hypothetical protein
MYSVLFIISTANYPSQDPNRIDAERYAQVTDDVTHWVLLFVLTVQQFVIPVFGTGCAGQAVQDKTLVTCHVGVVWWETIKDE